ncbi:hypothetical protein SAMN04488054_1623 [Salibacterium qingdaonense]|uniref:Uncharacterized protein n=1 Tax=Salibacterium qingdaonense TaxID=266892 RepID=A0A1I4R5K2_9BACI|nr:hypothetical protein SAMN04488054_1623 [Salibacterium qingdaonense]
MISSILITSIAVAIVVYLSITIAKVKDEETGKKDKGKIFNYYRLSYKRRFFRNLWTFPLAVLFFVICYVYSELNPRDNIFITTFFLLVALFLIIELVYNYIRSNHKK